MKHLLQFLLVAAAVLIMGLAAKSYVDCTSSGGTYIKSFVWYQCIKLN